MALTQISDVIVPDVFQTYLVARTREQSAFFRSGVVREDAVLADRLRQGGHAVTMPFWADLDGDDAVASDDPDTNITPYKVGGDEQTAVVLRRAVSFAAADLAGAVAGDDPMRMVADRIAPYWTRRLQAALIKMVDGVFKQTDMASDAVLDISTDTTPGATNRLSAGAVIEARGTLGDAADDIAVMVVHSKVYQQIQKNDLIDYVPESQGLGTIPTYMGMRLIQSDLLPTGTNGSETTYSSWLFGRGAIVYGEGAPRVPVAIDRDELGGNGEGIEYFVSRRHVCLHPLGMSYVGDLSTGISPANSALATGANWGRVFSRKQVPLAALITNL